jgi:tRNA threonylcarbamoyladenosine biosynthesis protein TsaB
MPAPQNLLAIDTATMHLKLAVDFGGDRMVKSDNRMPKTHGQMIMKKIDDLLQSAGLAKTSLQGIVISLGPGSFTGLRIGLAAAKGMATALEIPMIGISLFDLAAYKLSAVRHPVILFLPHRRDEFFAATIEAGQCPAESIKTVAAADVQKSITGKEVRVIGVDPARLATFTGNGSPVSVLEYDAADFIELGRRRFQSGSVDDPATLEPMYLQKSQAEIKFERRRKNQ